MKSSHGNEDIAEVCRYCLRNKYAYDEGKPRRALMDDEPCEFCESLAERGIVFIETLDTEICDGVKHISGRIAVAKPEYANLYSDAEKQKMLEERFVFVPQSQWADLEIPADEPVKIIRRSSGDE